MTYNPERLDYFISILRSKFPQYKFVNGMKTDCSEKRLLGMEYSVFVYGVPEIGAEEFSKFVFQSIYMVCAEADEDLPSIVTLQNRENIPDANQSDFSHSAWQIFEDSKPRVCFAPLFGRGKRVLEPAVFFILQETTNTSLLYSKNLRGLGRFPIEKCLPCHESANDYLYSTAA